MRRTRGQVVGVALVMVVALTGCNWAAVGFGPDNTNANPSEPTLTPASVAHLTETVTVACECNGIDGERPLVVDGVVYTSDFTPGDDNPPRDQTLRARDLATGAVRWSTTLKQVDIARWVGVANGIAYATVSLSGPSENDPPPGSDFLLAFDTATGRVRWLVVPPAPAPGIAQIDQVLVDGSHVFVVTGQSTQPARSELSALDATGAVLWQNSPETSSPVLVADPGHKLYAERFFPSPSLTSGVTVLSAYDEDTGSGSSRFIDVGPTSLVSIAFANGLLYGVGGPGIGLAAVHPDTGTRAWNVPNEGLVAVAPGVLVSLTNGGFAGRNPLTGALLWNNPTPGAAFDRIVAGGVLIAVSNNTLRAFSLATGAPAGTTTVAGLDPQVVAAGGRIVVGNGMGLHVLAPSG